MRLDEGADQGDGLGPPAEVAVLVETPECGREQVRRPAGRGLHSGRPGPHSGDVPASDRLTVTLVHLHLEPLDVNASVRAVG